MITPLVRYNKKKEKKPKILKMKLNDNLEFAESMQNDVHLMLSQFRMTFT